MDPYEGLGTIVEEQPAGGLQEDPYAGLGTVMEEEPLKPEAEPERLPTGPGFVAKETAKEIGREIWRGGIVQPVKSFGGGLDVAFGRTLEVLGTAYDFYADKISRATGIGDEQRKRGLQKLAEWYQLAGHKLQEEGVPDDTAAGKIMGSLYSGLGQAGWTISEIIAMKPLGPFAMGAVSAVEAAPGGAQEAAGAFARGVALQGILRGSSAMPKVLQAPTVATIFAGTEAAAGGDLEDVIASGGVGLLLSLTGRAPTMEQFLAPYRGKLDSFRLRSFYKARDSLAKAVVQNSKGKVSPGSAQRFADLYMTFEVQKMGGFKKVSLGQLRKFRKALESRKAGIVLDQDFYKQFRPSEAKAPPPPTPEPAPGPITPAPVELKKGQTVWLARRKSGLPYKTGKKVSVVQVLDEQTVRIQRPGKVEGYEEVQRDQLDIGRALEGARRRGAYLAGLSKEERAAVKSADRELNKILEGSLYFFPEEAHREALAAENEKAERIVTARWLKSARELAAKELGMEDVDVEDPRARAEMLPKLKVWMEEKGPQVMGAERVEMIHTAPPTAVNEAELAQDDLVFADGQWYQVNKATEAATRLEDAVDVDLADFESVEIQGVLKPEDPAYQQALSEYQAQEAPPAAAAAAAGYPAAAVETTTRYRAELKAAKPWPPDFPNVLVQTSLPTMKRSAGYEDAKAGDPQAAMRVVDQLIKPAKIVELARQFPDAIVVYVHAEEELGRNQIPLAYAERLASIGGLDIQPDIVQVNRTYHTGKGAAYRMVAAPVFDGPVQSGRNYILVDDVTTLGSTLSGLRNYIEAQGGRVVAATVLATPAPTPRAGYSGHLSVRPTTLKKLENKFDIRELEDLLYEYGIAYKIESLTNPQGLYFSGFKSVDAIRNKLAETGQPRLATPDTGIAPEAEDVRGLPPPTTIPPEGVTPPGGITPAEAPAMEGPHLPIELPELVEFARQLGQGKYPRILEKIRLLRGAALGAFRYKKGKPTTGKIELRADLFALVSPQEKARLMGEAREYAEQQADEGDVMRVAREKYESLLEEAEAEAKRRNPLLPSKVLAHEIGHWADFLPEGMIAGRGNILGRIGSLKRYTKDLIASMPAEMDRMLTERQRHEMRNKAAKLARFGVPSGSSKEAVQAETKKIYQRKIQEEIERRGLVTREAIVRELEPLVAWWRGTETMEPYFKKSEEMYAEAFSALMNNPAAVHERAPKFYSLFFNFLENNPKVKTIYDRIQKDRQLGQVQNERDRRQMEMMQSADEAAHIFEQEMYDMEWTEWRDAILMAIDRRFAPIYTRLRKAKDIPSAPKVRKAVADYLYHKGQHKLYLARMDGESLDVLRQANVPRAEFNMYLQNQHIVHNRADIASMGGMNPAASQQSLDAQQARVGPQAWAAMEQAEAARWKIRQELVLQPLEQAGLLDPELMKILRSRVKYSTVAAVDLEADPVERFFETTFGGEVSSRIYKQVGYLGAAKTPLLATAQKDLSLISMMHSQALRSELHDFLADIGDPMFRDATYKWDANVKRRVPKIVDNEKVKTLLYLDGGKVRGYYVGRPFYDMLVRTDSIDARAFISILRKPVQGMKSLWTSLNYGFWPFNYIRDTKGFVKRMPGVYSRLFGKNAYAKYRGRAYAAAKSIAQNRPDAIARKALQRNMLIHTSQWKVDSGEAYGAFEKLMLMHDVDPKMWGIDEPKGKTAFRKMWQKYQRTGERFEREVKIAGMLHLDEKFPNMPEAEKQRMVHEFAGSPNFMERGTMNWLMDAIFPFYNPAKQGYRSAFHAAHERPIEWIFKTMKYSVIPKLVIAALSAGGLAILLGKRKADEIAEMFASIPEYDRTNYDCLPIAWVDKDTRKVLYWRGVEEEEERIIGGTAAKILEGDYNPSDLINFASGQLPGINPLFKVGTAWRDYWSERQPIDRGGAIIERNRFQAGEGTEEMIKWTANQVGAGLIVRFNRDNFYDPTPTWIEQALNWPIVSNILGRFLRVSNRGLYEKAREQLRPLEKAAAKRRLRVREAITGAKVTPEQREALRTPQGQLYFEKAIKGKSAREMMDPHTYILYKSRHTPARAAALMAE